MKSYSAYQLFNGSPRWTCTIPLSEEQVEALRHCRKYEDGKRYFSTKIVGQIRDVDPAKHLILSVSMQRGVLLVDIDTPYCPS